MSWSVEADFRRIGGRAQVVMAPEAHAVESSGNRHPPVRVRSHGMMALMLRRSATPTHVRRKSR